jgi:hypothetical protein
MKDVFVRDLMASIKVFQGDVYGTSQTFIPQFGNGNQVKIVLSWVHRFCT